MIEAMSRKAFHWCYCMKKFDSISQLMLFHNWPNLQTRRADCDLSMYSRIVTGQVALDKEQFLPHQAGTSNKIRRRQRKY